jgi:hypothetical protein
VTVEAVMNGIAGGGRLPVFAIVVRAFMNVLGRPLVLLRIVALPAAGGVAIICLFAGLPWLQHPLGILFLTTLILPLSYIGFAWLRVALLQKRAGFVVSAPWLKAYGKLVGMGSLWLLWLIAAPTAVLLSGAYFLVLLLEMQSTQEIDSTAAAFVWIGLAILSTVPLGFSFLSAPAITVGMPGSPRAAWRAAAGQGLRLGGAVFFFVVSFLLMDALFIVVWMMALSVVTTLVGIVDAPIVAEVVIPAGSAAVAFCGALIGAAVFAELLGIAYRSLTGWSGPRQDILERFE